jgi:hypothetical protein
MPQPRSIIMVGQSEAVNTSSGSCWDHCIMWKFSILYPFAHYFKDVFHPKCCIQATLLVLVNLVLGLFSLQSKNKATLPMKQVGTMLDNHLQSVTLWPNLRFPIWHNYWLCLELVLHFERRHPKVNAPMIVVCGMIERPMEMLERKSNVPELDRQNATFNHLLTSMLI